MASLERLSVSGEFRPAGCAKAAAGGTTQRLSGYQRANGTTEQYSSKCTSNMGLPGGLVRVYARSAVAKRGSAPQVWARGMGNAERPPSGEGQPSPGVV